jgi:hypothetical protein
MANKLDADGKEIVAPEEKIIPEVPPAKPESKPADTVTLTTAQFEQIKADAVAEAKKADEEAARIAKAEDEKNYKLLLDEARADALKANQANWRTQARTKYNLSDALNDMLFGDTKEVIMGVAKKLRESIDAEVALKAKTELEGNPPPDPKQRLKSPREEQLNANQKTARNIGAALGIGTVRSVLH